MSATEGEVSEKLRAAHASARRTRRYLFLTALLLAISVVLQIVRVVTGSGAS